MRDMMPRSTPREPDHAEPESDARALPPRGELRRFILLLPDRFALMALAGAIEPLRIANAVAGRRLYAWILAGEDGAVARASCGLRVMLDAGLDVLEREDRILVIGGTGIEQGSSRAVLAWLRREARRGALVGGIGTGAWTLARAGLLDGRRATIQWEHQDSFAEEFDAVSLQKAPVVLDGPRASAAGGTAALDLMIRLVAADHGEELALAVADRLLQGTARGEGEGARPSAPARMGVRHPRLSQVIQMMERSLEEPVSPAELAERVGLSTRQLERLFRRHLNRSPKRYYMELRLQKARNLLVQTDMSVINVALACGFSSPSHFSKCYRAHFNTTPYRERSGQTTRLSF